MSSVPATSLADEPCCDCPRVYRLIAAALPDVTVVAVAEHRPVCPEAGSLRRALEVWRRRISARWRG